MQRLTGYNDSDLGSCSNMPLPPGCSNSSDTAWHFSYDADGNQLSQTDPRNQSRYSSYDNLDRPLCSALTAADANACSGSTDQVYFYDDYSNGSTPGATFPSGCSAPSGNYASDPIGRKTAEIFIGTSGAGSGWRCYGYDQRGETDQSTLSVKTPSASTLTQTVNMTYNDGGEITGLVYPGGETLTSTYDVNGRLQSIYFGTPSSPDPVAFLVGKVSYTNNGQVASMALGGSGNKNRSPVALFTTAMQYDSIQRPLSSTVTEAGQTIWSQTRAYDYVGNVLGLSTVVPTQGGGSATENESFCYDALNRLAWAGNTGTPSGGDHCMAPPTGSTLPAYSQAYSYDSLDRITSSSAGTYTYGDPSHVHAATNVSSIPNQYAAYDAMGNMTCRNTDSSSGHTCSGNSPTGATMSYDSRGQLASWTAPSGSVGNASYLYDNQGNRVLAHSSTASGASDTIYFDGYTETVMTGLTISTTKYYNANGAQVALRVGSAALDYLVSDSLSSTSMALNSSGQVIALQHYRPYGTVDYSWGTMPTAYNYTGQRLDSQTGLLYYGFRYYDPVVGQFVRADTTETNAGGMDGYAYVVDNPETKNDPTGHYFVGEGKLGQPEYAWGTNDGGLKVVQYYGNYGPPVWNQYTPAEIHRYTGTPTGPSTWQKILDGLGITDIQNTFNDPHASGWDKAGSILGALANDFSNLALAGTILFGGPEFAGAEEGLVGGAEALAQGGEEALAQGGAEAVAATKVDLYRAVGPSELDNLLRLGDYGLSPNESGKYFAMTEKGVWDYALSTFNEGRPMTVTHIEVPSEMLDKGYIFHDSGGAGLSIHFEDDVLINDLYKVMGLPEIIGAPWAGWGP